MDETWVFRVVGLYSFADRRCSGLFDLDNMIQATDIGSAVSSGIEIGRGISEVGLLAIAAGFFVVFSIMNLLLFYGIFKKLFNNLMEDKKVNENELRDSILDLSKQLEPMSDESRFRNVETIKKIAAKEFELSVEQVCNVINNVKTDNHVADNESYIQDKLRRLLNNIHRERSNYFTAFKHNGHQLNFYINPKWAERVIDVAFSEVYDPIDNPKRTRSNVKAIYDEIKIEFVSNLMAK